MFTHGIFMRAVAWALLTGVGGPAGDAPTSDDMRRFRRFTSLYPVPNAGILRAALLPG